MATEAIFQKNFVHPVNLKVKVGGFNGNPRKQIIKIDLLNFQG